jgi:membrane dipeptidase
MSGVGESVMIDGLLVSKWSEPVFTAMRDSGLTAANCTCAVWDDFEATMTNIAAFKRWFEEYPDLIVQVYTADDVLVAARERRCGVILGFQNASPIEDHLEYLPLFHELGVRIIQLTYNTMNYVGSGCYEGEDSGLSDFGRDVVSEMNRLGVLVDLSHVGSRTTRDAIAASEAPVAFSHIGASTLHPHRRNKSDEEIRAVAETGGVVGVALLTWFLPNGENSTVDDYLVALEHVANVAGEDHVALGTDFTEGHGPQFIDWIMRDKGTGRALVERPSEVRLTNPRGMERIRDLAKLRDAMETRGWSDTRIDKVLGANWLRLYREVWAGTGATSQADIHHQRASEEVV